MSDRNISGTRRKRRRRGAVYIPVAAFLIVLALIIGVSLFFRVTDITVEGAGKYSDEEILSVSGIETGDNTFFISETKAAINIRGNLPYVDTVKIVRTLPDKITIVVTESYPIASIASGDSCWILDKNCRLLEQTDSTGAAGTIVVSGLSLKDQVVGQRAIAYEEDTVKLDYLTQLLTAIMDKGLQESITAIDITTVSKIEFDYLGRFTVEFGRGENAAQKLDLLLQVVGDLGENERGTVDFVKDTEAHFIQG